MIFCTPHFLLLMIIQETMAIITFKESGGTISVGPWIVWTNLERNEWRDKSHRDVEQVKGEIKTSALKQRGDDASLVRWIHVAWRFVGKISDEGIDNLSMQISEFYLTAWNGCKADADFCHSVAINVSSNSELHISSEISEIKCLAHHNFSVVYNFVQKNFSLIKDLSS